ncbi:SDR family NAD(P)-dependent oxidoreductase [Deefgea piscis]|uniref:SDR family NAD(P)-dependent oxidoreductase n=1 Tax=Deefgea piscis TaxID=2739061 RepID=UPI001C7F0C33|nr:SDR family NAD(P)-dependent oxidoreductase [Deefgea piscis]QZA79830.1 SDR family NAD(P)-dependent oxidoreductase [Deefgea piscis]
MMVSNNGKVALITGGNKGLGKEIGRQLGALGYTVVLAARDVTAGAAAAAELVAAGYDAHTVRLEVTQADDIHHLVSYIESTFGKLDVLVNNAGIALEFDGNPTNADKVRRTLEVNLIAPYAITEALVPLLARSTDARVINQSSILGSISNAEAAWEQVAGFTAAGYSCSKAGLNMLTLIQSKTLSDQGIAVAAAHPGWVKTDLGSQAAPMEVDEGASTVVTLLTIDRAQFPHGQLRHNDDRLPW